VREVYKGVFPAIPPAGGNFHSRALNILEENPELFGERCFKIKPKIEREPNSRRFTGTYQECVDLVCIYDGLKRKSERYAVPVELKTISSGTLSVRDRAKAESQLVAGITYIQLGHREVAHAPYGVIVTVTHEGHYEWERIYWDILLSRWEFNQSRKRRH
jgi:hypothetical protein